MEDHDRALNEDGGQMPTAAPIAAPVASPTPDMHPKPSLAPAKGGAATPETDDGDAKILAVFPFVAIILCFLAFRCFRYLKRRKDQRMMNLRSQAADAVLGDMQMLPSEDPDAELL